MQYMKKYIKNIVPATFMMLALGATSCIGDLDVDPYRSEHRYQC